MKLILESSTAQFNQNSDTETFWTVEVVPSGRRVVLVESKLVFRYIRQLICYGIRGFLFLLKFPKVIKPPTKYTWVHSVL